ncbi:phosphate ABC transporter permease PstA [Helicobacter anatolicus]|uniref:phosphate ABC transporter permease PstA n=1 Tax=Helicobacter anatolicus TaxID=2905874 RepID=UPI001E4A0E1D|nr:phosphate ABC transporter permease PstA [Helicobacter anatolicus]MCE3036390.1 phosphate ABC transporter permease PstA [Helicobacter anatolicus]MCE3040308.1 phosphate ABC transporter permease PstA [Helicobacter anatolicus]
MKIHKDILSLFLLFCTYSAIFIVVCIFVILIGYILFKGIPALQWQNFSPTYNSVNVSMLPAIINTIFIVFASLLLSTPIGVFGAIYLVEYAKKNSKFLMLINLMTETLSGIPSIVFGLFGYLLFVVFFGFGYSFFSGVLTLSIMILPLIIKTTQEALMSVPVGYKEGSFALGIGKLKTIFYIILPSSLSGIISGIILSTGRIIGESAALIYTSGTLAQIFQSGFDSGRSLSVHMYALLSEGLYINQAYGAASILLVVVILLNLLSTLSIKYFTKGRTCKS